MSEFMDQLQFTLTLSTPPAAETAANAMTTTKKTPLKKGNAPKPLLPSFPTAPTWAVQCIECRKWRVIPTQEEYEEIRRKIVEDPFSCKRKENVSCSDPGDVEWGMGSIWVMDKPNLPKSPAGFKRKLTMRNNMNRLDCFYETPYGKKLRSPTEVVAFLAEHLECKGVSPLDFDFRAPKIAKPATPMVG